MTISNANCCVCNELTNKYKCPKCSSPYCSLICFKKHKEIPCEKEVQEIPFFEDRFPQKTHLFTTIDTVKMEKLEELRNSEPLKCLLQNTHLRQFLQEIDQAPNAWNAMKAAMLEPLFLEFADECLKTVDSENAQS